MSLTPQRLKKLVTYRERLERLQERELALTFQRKTERQRALDQAHGDRQSLLDYEPEYGDTLDPDLLAASGHYLRRVDRDIVARSAALATSDAEVARERDALLVRRRDHKAMETLLDHARDRQRREREKAAMAAIDEQAGARWLRNHGR
jgi:flagellar export protein FliJ